MIAMPQHWGRAIYQSLLALVALVVVVVIAWGLISGRFWAWRADVWKDKATQAAGEAVSQKANATSARAAASNAIETRERIARVVVEVRDRSDARAERIESHADTAADVGELDPAVLRELADAEAEYRAASARLRRP